MYLTTRRITTTIEPIVLVHPSHQWDQWDQCNPEDPSQIHSNQCSPQIKKNNTTSSWNCSYCVPIVPQEVSGSFYQFSAGRIESSTDNSTMFQLTSCPQLHNNNINHNNNNNNNNNKKTYDCDSKAPALRQVGRLVVVLRRRGDGLDGHGIVRGAADVYAEVLQVQLVGHHPAHPQGP